MTWNAVVVIATVVYVIAHVLFHVTRELHSVLRSKEADGCTSEASTSGGTAVDMSPARSETRGCPDSADSRSPRTADGMGGPVHNAFVGAGSQSSTPSSCWEPGGWGEQIDSPPGGSPPRTVAQIRATSGYGLPPGVCTVCGQFTTEWEHGRLINDDEARRTYVHEVCVRCAESRDAAPVASTSHTTGETHTPNRP